MKTKTTIALAGVLGILVTSAMAQNGSGTNGTQTGSGPQYNRPATPAEVQTQLQQFKRDREAFMAKQGALEQQLKDASAQERDRIREQLKTQMEQFQKDQARVREQLCDQTDRQRTQLRDHTRILDRTSNPGTAPAPGGQNTQTGGARGR